ncbi:MAG: hypothetical protein EOS19_25510 [Mesorhizobium sp.]|nr:hypothetical protein [Mesorhizobium sp.]RWQ26416.1 MAG: hypothetical protein EOS19_25510 [Mesorhizobium sp.]
MPARKSLCSCDDELEAWFAVVQNLARGMIRNGVNQLWVADITFLHLAEELPSLPLSLTRLAERSSDVRWIRILEQALPSSFSRWRSLSASPYPGASSIIPTAGFKRPSQHSEVGGCDEHSKAAIGTVWTGKALGWKTPAEELDELLP